MIQQPPPGAQPTLQAAALWPIAISGGLALGVIVRALGAGESVEWGGMVLGHMIVTAILAAPFIIVLASALWPQAMVWGTRDTLLFRTVRASLFMVGFVILYLGINIVAFKMPLMPWAIGALLSACMTLAWYGFLRIGPWSSKSNPPKS
jgi:hypothetical protein